MKTRRVHKGRKTSRHTNKRHSRHTNKRHSRHTNKRHSGRHTNKRKSTKGGGKNTNFNQAAYYDALYIGEQNLREVDPKAQAKYNEKMNKKCPKLDCIQHKDIVDRSVYDIMRNNEQLKEVKTFLNQGRGFFNKLNDYEVMECLQMFKKKCNACEIEYDQFDENLSDDEVNKLMETLKTKYNLSQNELDQCITDNQFKKVNIKNDPYALVSVSNESMFNEDKTKKGNKKKSSGSQYGFDATSLNSDASLFNPKDPNYKFEFQRPHPGSEYDVDE